MSLDPNTTQLLARLEGRGLLPSPPTPSSRRDVGRHLVIENGPGPRMREVRSCTLPGSADGVELRALVPTSAPTAVLLWFTDALGVLPGADGVEVVMRKLAERTGAIVVLVDDLPGDHPGPDAAALAARAAQLVYDHLVDRDGTTLPLIAGGVGSGALLAGTVALAARDHGGPAVALQVLVCPALDASPARHDDGPGPDLLQPRDVAGFWGGVLRSGPGATPGWTTPLGAGRLDGLPPAVVLTAAADPLLDDGRRYAARLRESGVTVHYVEYDGQIHDFLSLLMLPASESGFQQIVRSVRTVIVRGSL